MTPSSNAYEVALEWLKQLITLSSGIIAFSGTFVPLIWEILGWPLILLGISWVFFISVIILCLEVVSAITYSRLHVNEDWSKGKYKTMALIAKWCFIGGIIVFVAFSATSIYSIVNNSDTAECSSQSTNLTPEVQCLKLPLPTATYFSTLTSTPNP